MRILLKNALVLDAETENEKLDVLIEDETIAAVGAALAVDDAAVVELEGKTLLPGFIDSHVHVVAHNEPREEMLRAFAVNGVAAVRDLGILGDMELEPYMAWLSDHRGSEYAQVVTAGRYIDVQGGYGMGPDPSLQWGMEIQTAEEAAEKVAYEAACGVDGIKIGLQDGALGAVGSKMPPEFIRAIVEKAHSLGLWTTAHIGKVQDLQTIVDCGIGSAAHTPKDAPMPDELIEKMVAGGMPMTTTVGDPYQHVANMPRIPPMYRTREEFLESSLQRREMVLANLARFYRAGGVILAATDLIRLNDPMAEAVIPTGELRYLRDIGMTTQQVIAAATINNARACHIGDLGLVKTGMRASLIAVDGALDATFAKLEHPAFVINRGVILKNEF